MELRAEYARTCSALSILACLTFLGCDDEAKPEADEDSEHDAQSQQHEDTVEDDAGTALPPARYVFATQVFSGESSTTYLVASDHFEVPTLSLKDATVVPGRAIVASSGEDGSLFVGSGDSPQLTRYSLNDRSELVKGPVVSFQSKGVAGIGEYQTQFQFISETKAYYFDAKTTQAVVFNPKAMTVTSSIDLKQLASPTHVVAFASTPTRRGDQVVMPVGFRSLNNAQIVDGAAVVIIDSKDDSFEIARDDRCGYVRDAVTTEDGTIYVATEAYGSAVHRLSSANAPAPCLLRIPVDETSFDPDFIVRLNDLADGKAVGSLLRLPTGEVLTKVLDEKLTAIGAMTSARGLASAAAWSWSEVTLGDKPTLTPVSALPASSGSLIWFRADDALLLAEFVNVSESTKLRNLSDGRASVVASSEGLLFSLALVR